MERANSELLCGWYRELVFGKLLLVFQMPKTGSQTVEATLQGCSLPHRIVRCHYLSSGQHAQLRRAVLAPGGSEAWKQLAQQQLDVTGRLALAIRIRNLLRLFRFRIPKLEVITAVREPIGLVLSSLFENYLHFVSQPELLTLELCGQELQRPRLWPPLEDWFDLELKAVTGLDVYQSAFPRQRG